MKKVMTMAAIIAAAMVSAKDGNFSKTHNILFNECTNINITLKSSMKISRFNIYDILLKDLQLCTIGVTFYDINGNITGFKAYSAFRSSEASCTAFQQSIISELIKQGYRISTGFGLPQSYSLE